MAKTKGDVFLCLRTADHHISPNKLKMIDEYRLGLVREEIGLGIGQLKKIEKIAKEKGYKDILDILGQELEFGHDL